MIRRVQLPLSWYNLGRSPSLRITHRHHFHLHCPAHTHPHRNPKGAPTGKGTPYEDHKAILRDGLFLRGRPPLPPPSSPSFTSNALSRFLHSLWPSSAPTPDTQREAALLTPKLCRREIGHNDIKMPPSQGAGFIEVRERIRGKHRYRPESLPPLLSLIGRGPLWLHVLPCRARGLAPLSLCKNLVFPAPLCRVPRPGESPHGHIRQPA